MKFDLASHVKRPSRRPIVLANIKPTAAQADTLFAIYAKVIAPWIAAQATINAAYERGLAKLQLDSADDVQGAFDLVNAEIQRLILLLTPELRDWAWRVETVQRGKWVASVLSATDIDLNTVLSRGDVQETVDAIVNWNVSLIRDVSDQTRQRIANLVFSGFQQRRPAAEIARDIRDAVGMSTRRARNIASDQTVKLGARLNQARQEQAGITSFKWRHSAKRHPRLWHEARDQHVYSWEHPGIPADDLPGVPPFCGCTAQGVVTFDEPTA